MLETDTLVPCSHLKDMLLSIAKIFSEPLQKKLYNSKLRQQMSDLCTATKFGLLG